MKELNEQEKDLISCIFKYYRYRKYPLDYLATDIVRITENYSAEHRQQIEKYIAALLIAEVSK